MSNFQGDLSDVSAKTATLIRMLCFSSLLQNQVDKVVSSLMYVVDLKQAKVGGPVFVIFPGCWVARPVLPFYPKHWLGHPENEKLSLSKNIFFYRSIQTYKFARPVAASRTFLEKSGLIHSHNDGHCTSCATEFLFERSTQFGQRPIRLRYVRIQEPTLFISASIFKIEKIFFGYFNPENLFLDNKNKQ